MMGEIGIDAGFERGIDGIADGSEVKAAALLGNRRMLVIYLTVLDRGTVFFKDLCPRDKDRALRFTEDGVEKPLSYYTCAKRVGTLRDKLGIIRSVPYPGYAGRTAYRVTYEGREIAVRMRALLARLMLKKRVARVEDGYAHVPTGDFESVARRDLGVDPDLVISALGLVEENGYVRIPVRAEEERASFDM